jgi:hypothetical protein
MIKRLVSCLFLGIMGVSCGDDPEPCLVASEIVMGDSRGPRSKIVLTHDGQRYIKMETYAYNNNVVDERMRIVSTVSYNSDGHIHQLVNTNNAGDIESIDDFAYVRRGQVNLLTRYNTSTYNGVTNKRIHSIDWWVRETEEGFYQENDSVLWEFENGNFIRTWFRGEGYGVAEAMMEYQGNKWFYQRTYYYDDKTNMMTDPVLRMIFWAPNYGYNRNYLIEEDYTISNTLKYKKPHVLEYDRGRLKKWTYAENGSYMTFDYECE